MVLIWVSRAQIIIVIMIVIVILVAGPREVDDIDAHENAL